MAATMIGTSWCGTVFYRVRYGAVRYIHLAIPDRKFIVSNQNIFRENEAGQAKMRAVFSDYFVFSVLLLFFFLFGVKLCTLASFLALIIVCNYKHRQDYIQNETKDSKTHDTDFVYRGDFADDLKTSDVTDSFNLKSASTVRCLNDNHCSDWSISTADRVTNSFFNIPSIMWKNQSIPFSKESPSKPKTRMNTTMPLVTTSPMSARQRKNNLNGSMTAATGSLLSTPFLPQIKRALGLEPRSQVKYGLARRHSLSVPPSTTSTMSSLSPAGTVPHVRLNRSRRSSLSDRNTSMLNRSSTVKIAPPTPGKIASPSLYQMRNDVSVADDRSTPDTFAVVNALKERRKRSITSHDETPDLPVHHAKRRRQESQQSNASTSSLPGPPMPDNLPDLSNASFALRMETPSLKRPSRPSQDTPGDWDREREGSAKRLRGEMRNNSILSSLSSSRRFAEKQTLERSQSTKRKAERSFPGKENETSQSKLQKTDTLVLQKADTICVSELAKKKPELSQSKEETVILTNGHTDNDEEVPVTSEASQTPTKSKPAVPTLKTIPSMKKSATVYSGLVSRGSFTKAHYANIVATAEDYESDRETEQKRVKQMLQDLDDSFSKEEAKSAGLTTDSATSVVATSTTSVPAITIAASTVSIATTTVTIATSTQPSVLSSLAALSQLAKSPIQETGPIQESGAASKSEESGTSATTSTSVASSPKFKPLFGPLSTTETVSSVSEAKPTGFSFGLNTTATAPVIGQSVTSSAIGQPSSLGAPPPYSFGQLTSVTSASGATTLAANITSNPVPSAALSSSSNFSFGLNQPKTQSAVSAGLTKNTTASAPSALGFSASAQAPAATTSGLTFSVAGAQPGLSSNFSSTAATTTSASTAGVLAFGQPPASLASSAGGGFSFGQIPSTLAASAGGFEQTSTSQTSSTGIGFGQTPGTASSAGGFAFGQTPSVTSSAPGFSFGQGTVTSTNSAAPSAAGFAFGQTTSTGASAPGFSFGQTSTVTTASSGGFSFGIGLSTAKPSAATNLFPTVSLAPAAGGFSFAGTAAGSAPAFGNPTSTQPSTGFAFGASTAGSTPAFSFAANPAVTTIAPSQPLQFGASTTTAAVGFSFGAGGAATTQATPFGAPASTGPAFGAAATSVAPAFGAPSGSSMFAFGAGLSGTGATASPFQANAPATPVGGFSFGQNTGSTAPSFAFGAKSASAPSFGASNPSAPTFGSTSQSGSVFGGAGTHAGVKSNTPVFGTSHSQSNTPTFGTSTNPATAFGPKSLTPTFGSSTNNNAGFSFGQQPAPNVNPFGQTTPSKQTGSAFGQTGLQSTPQQQTGSVYQFGQSGTQQASTGVKGFDFSAAAGGTGSSSGFNFFSGGIPVFNFTGEAAGGTPGGFGTPSLTPTGTPTPGGFSMGSAPRPPRVMSKARRRTTRK